MVGNNFGIGGCFRNGFPFWLTCLIGGFVFDGCLFRAVWLAWCPFWFWYPLLFWYPLWFWYPLLFWYPFWFWYLFVLGDGAAA